jgi:adenylylsulfate kinase
VLSWWGLLNLAVRPQGSSTTLSNHRCPRARTMNSDILPFSVPGVVIWLTGLSGAGKSTIANALSHELTKAGTACFVLDGDDIRAGLNSDLGFSREDRLQNVRRIAHVAKLISSRGQVVVVAAITPSHATRALARETVGETFREVFVDTPLSLCEERDPKGLYRKARSGTLKAFTGVSDLYERPVSPDLVLRTNVSSIFEETQRLLALIHTDIPAAPEANASTTTS